jgi:hypothetical protein
MEKQAVALALPVEVKTIEDPIFYQEFFAKVDKGIFIRKQKL